MGSKNVDRQFKNLLTKVKHYLSKQDYLDLIAKAFEFSRQAHEGQYRYSKEPFITHPLALADILADLKLDATTIAAGLLHDVIEDTPITREQLVKEFSKNISSLVEGVSKLSTIKFTKKEEQQVENYRKMFLAMAKDIRIILIKLADRLHNMRTLEFVPKEKQKRIAQETMDVYAPLAHRLGIASIKWELEDLAFRYLNPEEFQRIKQFIVEKRRQRESYVKTIIKELETLLKGNKLKGIIQGRPKHFFSIHHKIVTQNLTFADLYDLTAIRIIVDTVSDCYSAVGLVHAKYKPIQGTFNDYIAMPKSNSYQSLHTTVIGREGKPVEIQIRTQEMHQIAEQGIAAHWKYKQGDLKDKKFEKKLQWLRQLIDWQKELANAKDYLHNLKTDIFSDEVFVFTPKGDVINLPNGATIIDFAFRIHTDIGNKTTGGKINQQIVPLNKTLANGDIVEVITKKNAHPSLDWLNFTITHQAKSKIKSWFRKRNVQENIKAGKQSLDNALRNILLKPQEVLTAEYIQSILKHHKIKELEDIYRGIAAGEFSAVSIAKRIKTIYDQKQGIEPSEIKEIAPDEKSKVKMKHTEGVIVAGADDVLVHLAKCCKPVPGDAITGVVTKGYGVSVHRYNCHNVTQKKDIHTVAVSWLPAPHNRYPVEIEIKGFNRVGLLKDIMNAVAETKTNISEAKAFTLEEGGVMLVRLIMEIDHVENLAKVIQIIRKIDDVYDVYRAKL